MLKSGVLNPHLLSLLARVRHTNWIVIADRGFPYWPDVETVDLALVDDLPTVLDVVRAIQPNFVVGHAWMANEFMTLNDDQTRRRYVDALGGVEIVHEPHTELKRRVPNAIGLVRTGDTTQYGNIVLESA